MQSLQGTTFRNEILGGLTTFFTMAYIVVVNPAILSTPGTGMPFNGVLTATVLTCFLMTLLMGLIAKLPFAVAPGMGINAFFTFTLILGKKIEWPTALGMVFWSGVLFLLLSLTPLREKLASAIPKNLRSAAAIGIGVFLTFIGLKNAGLVVDSPATLVQMGPLSVEVCLFVFGLLLAAVLFSYAPSWAFLSAMAVVTGLGALFGKVSIPDSLISSPDFTSVFFKLDIVKALTLGTLPAIVSLFFTDLFDSLTTFIGVSRASGLVDEKGEPKNLKKGLIVDALATFFAGLFGTSSATAYIESAAGIKAGGKTGLSSVVTAICFLPCLFFAPLAAMVPSFATAPVLVIVGALMFSNVKELRLENVKDVIPTFLTIILIPLTFSITQGILWGLFSHSVLSVFSKDRSAIRGSELVLGGLALILLIVENQG